MPIPAAAMQYSRIGVVLVVIELLGASCASKPASTGGPRVVFPASAPDDWGKIKWGEPVDGLQIGLVYWNDSWETKALPGGDLDIEIYFRNVSDHPIFLIRPEPDAYRPWEARDPRIGIRFTAPNGDTFTGPAFSPSKMSTPSLLAINPGETRKESGALFSQDCNFTTGRNISLHTMPAEDGRIKRARRLKGCCVLCTATMCQPENA